MGLVDLLTAVQSLSFLGRWSEKCRHRDEGYCWDIRASRRGGAKRSVYLKEGLDEFGIYFAV